MKNFRVRLLERVHQMTHPKLDMLLVDECEVLGHRQSAFDPARTVLRSQHAFADIEDIFVAALFQFRTQPFRPVSACTNECNPCILASCGVSTGCCH